MQDLAFGFGFNSDWAHTITADTLRLEPCSNGRMSPPNTTQSALEPPDSVMQSSKVPASPQHPRGSTTICYDLCCCNCYCYSHCGHDGEVWLSLHPYALSQRCTAGRGVGEAAP